MVAQRPTEKAPPKSGAKFATHLGFACEAANPPLNVERRSWFPCRTPNIVGRTERGHWLDTMPNPNSRTEIGTRLVLTRKALDYTQTAMAGLMGIDGQTLAAYEAGRRRIPMKQALKLCPYGIPLDWIYQGQMANLHPHIREKILEQAPQS